VGEGDLPALRPRNWFSLPLEQILRLSLTATAHSPNREFGIRKQRGKLDTVAARHATDDARRNS